MTIRAQVPVETPAGLMVALPPCTECLGVGRVPADWESPTPEHEPIVPCPQCRPDVFALAVPCPTCQGTGTYIDTEGYGVMCTHDNGDESDGIRCGGTGWVHHGDYRVLKVRPLVADARSIPGVPCITVIGNGRVYECVAPVHPDDPGGANPDFDLPDAVPGGVALIVEQVACPACGVLPHKRFLSSLSDGCPVCNYGEYGEPVPS